jgi:uncharacterized membrane protein (UPF0127 family)
MNVSFFKIIFFIVAVSIIGFIAFRSAEQMIGEDEVRVGDVRFFVKIADDYDEYLTGLSGHPGLRVNEGMYFLFDAPDRYGFWMKDMLFPIDIVWVRNGAVIGVSEDVPVAGDSPPKLYYPPAPVDAVLEVRAGTVIGRGIKVGDRVELIRVPTVED